MTDQYRDEEFKAFERDDLWELAVTDAFGMVCPQTANSD
jgi:hypothetical protein